MVIQCVPYALFSLVYGVILWGSEVRAAPLGCFGGVDVDGVKIVEVVVLEGTIWSEVMAVGG